MKAFGASPSKKNSDGKKSPPNYDWKEFDSEPLKGWKCKSDSAGHQRYLSPSGDYINSQRHVMKFLVENKYNKDAISAMRTTFKGRMAAEAEYTNHKMT